MFREQRADRGRRCAQYLRHYQPAGAPALGVVLTGMNADGAQGLARIKKRGGVTVVQAPSEAEHPMMPAAAIAASPIDHVLTLAEIPPLLARLCPGLTK